MLCDPVQHAAVTIHSIEDDSTSSPCNARSQVEANDVRSTIEKSILGTILIFINLRCLQAKHPVSGNRLASSFSPFMDTT